MRADDAVDDGRDGIDERNCLFVIDVDGGLLLFDREFHAKIGLLSDFEPDLAGRFSEAAGFDVDFVFPGDKAIEDEESSRYCWSRNAQVR